MLSSLRHQPTSSNQSVLVCGLGRLGQQCVKALAGYRVPVRGVDLHVPGQFDAPAEMTIGDFRNPEVLRQAGIENCRSIMLLAGDAAANIEGAFAARRVNPHIRLVVRAEQQPWNKLLLERLGNVVVYEPNRLAAPAFAFAVLDTHILAHFYLDDQLCQITEHHVQAGERWVGMPIESFQVSGRQILLHVPADRTEATPPDFYDWHPEAKIGVGDKLLILTRSYTSVPDTIAAGSTYLETVRWLWRDFQRQRREGFTRAGVVALSGLGSLCVLLILAVILFSATSPFLPVGESLRLAVMLLTGGHLADVLVNYERAPAGMHWAEVVLTVSGTLLTAVIYALLTDRLLTARFNLARRKRVPSAGHVIIAGLGATGERIASLLEQLRRPAVAIESGPLGPHVPPHLPVIRARATLATSLEEAHLSTAHGLVAATADELQNVEIALLAASLNPNCRLAVRIFDPRLSENVSSALPDAKVLCISKLAATAYAAAALGEQVISLFEVLGQPVLVVEYIVNSGDTLERRALWEIAEGYYVVPVLFHPEGGLARAPSFDDYALHLAEGDRLVVLASATSLEAIERGELRPREYELRLDRLRPYAEPLQIVGLLTQHFGYTLDEAQNVLANLPQNAPQRMYGLYARRTFRLLQSNGVMSSLRRVTSHGPRGIVENLSRRPAREPTVDVRRSLGQAGQSRERATSSHPPTQRADQQT
jgi:Trk K+ transport system NAD-binding subunit